MSVIVSILVYEIIFNVIVKQIIWSGNKFLVRIHKFLFQSVTKKKNF